MTRLYAAGKASNEIILHYIMDYKKAHDGNSPTLRLIGEGCYLSPTAVFFRLQTMKETGMLKNVYGIETVKGRWLPE